MPRGEALRLADELPELHVLVVGKPVEAGDANDAPKAPVLAGSTLVVETSNHLQTVGVVDLFVRGRGDAPLVFADAGGVAQRRRAPEPLRAHPRSRGAHQLVGARQDREGRGPRRPQGRPRQAPRREGEARGRRSRR